MFNVICFILSCRYYLSPRCCYNNIQGEADSPLSLFLGNYSYFANLLKLNPFSIALLIGCLFDIELACWFTKKVHYT